MLFVSIYLTLYSFLFIFDVIPQIRTKKKKSLAVYLPVFFLTLTVNIFYGLGFDIPSPTEPIEGIIVRIFRLQ